MASGSAAWPPRSSRERFGTPLYVYDAATLRERAQAYVDGVAGHPDAHVSFACKACCTVGRAAPARATAGWAPTSPARASSRLRCAPASIPALIVVHGNGKTDADIEAALAAGCGLVVLDALGRGRARGCRGRAPRPPSARRGARHARHRGRGHEKIATAHAGSKFGLAPADAARACIEARADPRLDWRGLHVHLGSQVDDPGVLEGVVRWFRAFCDEHALEPRLIDVGGGLGIPYGHESAPGRPGAGRRGRGGRAAPVPRRAAPDRARAARSSAPPA